MNKISQKTIMISMAILMIASVSAFGIYIYNPTHEQTIDLTKEYIYVDGIDTSFNFAWVLNYNVRLLPENFNKTILTRIK